MAVLVLSADPGTWSEVVLVASPILGTVLGAAIAFLAAYVSLKHARRQNDARMNHESQLKTKELEAAREARLRGERIAAYRKLLAATVQTPVTSEEVARLSEAYAEIELLVGSPQIEHAATGVWTKYGKVRDKAKELQDEPTSKKRREFTRALNDARQRREAFLELARRELGIEGEAVNVEEE